MLFGNGLGRSLSPAYFPLEAGIRNVWASEDDVLTDANKNAIIQCLPIDGGDLPEMPTSEGELSVLHKVVTACKLIGDVEREDPIWLTEHGRNFPEVIDHFIGRVALYYHRCNEVTDEYIECVSGVSWFAENYCTHIATLNYDNLLYQPLIETGVLSGYSGSLLDGFTGMTFDEANLTRHNSDLGWYLHLHGSPLFYDYRNQVKKMHQARLESSFDTDNILHRHIVLNHTEMKPEVISGSPLLSSYWEFFGRALEESSNLVVFGYGGGDSHINKRISNWVRSRKKQRENISITVVEYRDPGKDLEARRNFWKQKLDGNGLLSNADLTMHRHENILNFDWKSLA